MRSLNTRKCGWKIVAFGVCETLNKRSSQTSKGQVFVETAEDSTKRSSEFPFQVVVDVWKAIEKLPQVYKHGSQPISVQCFACGHFFIFINQ